MASNRQRDGGRSGDRRGFASMDPQKQRMIAKKGGEASSKIQRRDAQGQFAGSGGNTRSSGSNAGSGSNTSRSTSHQGGRGRSGGSTR
jgi:hypothetical protein